MQINSLQPAASSLGVLRPDSSGSLSQRLTQSIVPSSFADPSAGSMRDILAHYDLRKISPRSFSEMLQRLHDAGQIDESEFRELSLIRLELDQAGLDPDQEIDLIALLEKKLRERIDELDRAERKSDTPLSAADRKAALGSLERHVEWLHKFDAIHQNRGAATVDSLA